jgi:hypothetical protein
MEYCKPNWNELNLTQFYFIWCDVKIYLCQQKMSQRIEKWKYTLKMIEMIFNLYESCNIY